MAWCCFFTSRTSAEEPPLPFLHALQEQGYGDTALDYLGQLEKRPDLPPAIREILDFERFNCYRFAVRTAYDARQNEQFLAEAQIYLDKFLREHPQHPQAASALLSWGDFTFDRALQLLGAARATKEKEKQTALRAEARTALTEAGNRFAEAEKRFLANRQRIREEEQKVPSRRPDGKPPAAPGPAQDAELGALEARFKAVLAQYYIAQTFENGENPQRKQLLQKTARRFDDIYQEYRNNINEVCLYAHLWQGRTLEELGDLQTAADVYDEVLAGAPETGVGDPAQASLFAQAAYFRFRIQAAKGNLKEFVAEAARWIQAHKNWWKIPAYNGVILETAKGQIALAEKATGEAKTKLLQQAAVGLTGVAKVESEYKQEALLLHCEIVKKMGRENLSAEEYLALGDVALNAGRTSEARENYTQALDKARDAKDPQEVEEVTLRLNRVFYAEALELYAAGKYAEALSAADKLSRGDAADASVANAAALAVSSALMLYTAAADKDAAWMRLEKVARFVIEKWPGRPEADDARMALAQAHLQRGDAPAALSLLRQVKPESRRYPTALYLLGQIYWKDYFEQKKKGETSNEQLLNESRTKARQNLQECVEILQKRLAWEGNTYAPDEKAGQIQAAQLAEARLLLGEIYLEGKQYPQTIALVDPLIAKIRAARPKSIDLLTFRTLMTAVRAHLARKEPEKAAEIALLLIGLSEDTAEVNEVLVNFAKLLGEERKRAEAAALEVPTGDPRAPAAAAKRDALRQLLVQVLEALGRRRHYSLADLVYLGDAELAQGLSDQAGQIYQRILEKAKKDPALAQRSGKALVWVHAQWAGILRAQGKYEEALRQAEAVIAKYPHALEPKMTKASILEDWAQTDPKKFDAAVTQWTEIRVALGRLPRKPPEYYEAVYRVASCLYQQSEKTNDPAKLLPAEQILKATLILNSKLSGPDLVTQYHELLKKIEKAKGED